jgi:ubiquinone/menaquinone biosynthesis C-methylase UbiE
VTATDPIRSTWEAVWTGHLTRGDDAFADRFTQEAFRRLRPLFDDGDRSIGEIGCGTGRFCCLLAETLPHSTLHGIDVSDTSIRVAAETARARGCANAYFKQDNLAHLAIADGHFDAVFSQGLIPLFPPTGAFSAKEAVRELVRVTRPGGKVIVTATNRACFPHTWYKRRLQRKNISYEYGFEKSYSRRELRALLAGAGLQNIQIEGYYPAYGFYRLAQRLRRGKSALKLCGKLVDAIDGPWLSRTFGFELIGIARKSSVSE